ncbi:MAG: oxygen-dependent coproporphyrinogen oxidase [Acidimicrobiia bacterium]|nr:oxygen-dependent coproporphyrinogen oxidase [Acidimicrobiia bacterium]
MAGDVFDSMVTLATELQTLICGSLEGVEPDAVFESTHWERGGGGGGHTRVLQGGSVFEKAGVNTSVVYGAVPPGLATELPGDGETFRATGISLVLHPRSPMVPTTHANYRRIERGEHGWFGGGADLTPHYLFEEDARHFHRVHAEVCAAHPGVADYPSWKQACDDYFYLPHRREHRGVGGIFFDHVEGGDDVLAFVAGAGHAFLDAYLPIVRRRMATGYGDRERTHQLVRRGRYVEFNLVYDRGTTFGLRSGGNVESILMSLPDPVRWVHEHEPEPDSWEARTIAALREPRDWLGSTPA